MSESVAMFPQVWKLHY